MLVLVLALVLVLVLFSALTFFTFCLYLCLPGRKLYIFCSCLLSTRLSYSSVSQGCCEKSCIANVEFITIFISITERIDDKFDHHQADYYLGQTCLSKMVN